MKLTPYLKNKNHANQLQLNEIWFNLILNI